LLLKETRNSDVRLRPRNPPKKTAKERLQEFYRLFGKEDEVLILINADPDALAGAWAVKRMLRYRVRNVVIGCPNEVRRLSNVAMIELLRIPVERLINLKTKEYNKKILIDSQPLHHPSFENLKFDAVIDHHPVTTGWEATYIDIRPDYGASASMLIEYLRAAAIKPSVALATALFYAIKVDTHNFEKRANLSDAIQFRYLFNLANQNLVRKIELSEIRLSELNYFRTTLAEMKVSKNRIYAHVGRVRNPDILVMIADFLNKVHRIAWVFISGIHGDRLVVIFRCDGYKKNAGQLAEKIFAASGSAGGHREAARAEVPCRHLEGEDAELTTNTLKKLITRHM
jgi:nanoRNase/pAp phosphatase (c-di-AMP/oligoRNAs hydrolase)